MKKSVKTVLIVAVVVIGGVAVIGAITGQGNRHDSTATIPTSVASSTFESSDVKSDYNYSSDTSSIQSEPSDVDVSKVVYDKNGIKITYKGLENQYNITTKLKFLVENSNSESYTVQTTDVTIDGFTYSTIMSTTIAAGKKASDSIVVLDSDFEENGTSYKDIKTVEIGLTLWGESNILDHTKDKITFTIQ